MKKTIAKANPIAKLQMAYFTVEDANKYAYFTIPQLLVSDDYYNTHLSDSSKLLYGILLDRNSLSKRNGWIDAKGRVYIIFTYESIMETMNCREGKATKMIKELIDIGLIERVIRGQGKPAIIYVKDFEKGINTTKSLTCENRRSRPAKIATQDLRKSQCNNTDLSNTDMNIGNNPLPPKEDTSHNTEEFCNVEEKEVGTSKSFDASTDANAPKQNATEQKSPEQCHSAATTSGEEETICYAGRKMSKSEYAELKALVTYGSKQIPQIAKSDVIAWYDEHKRENWLIDGKPIRNKKSCMARWFAQKREIAKTASSVAFTVPLPKSYEESIKAQAEGIEPERLSPAELEEFKQFLRGIQNTAGVSKTGGN